MIHLGMTAIRNWLGALLHIHDSPQRTALAYALGVFFGFSPFLGLHTALALLLAFVFGLNRIAILLGVYSNLPWIVAPYYTLATVGGARLLGRPLPVAFGQRFAGLFDRSFFEPTIWSKVSELLRPLLWPYAAGTMVSALVLGAVSYPLALTFIVAGRKHLHLRSHGAGRKDGP